MVWPMGFEAVKQAGMNPVDSRGIVYIDSGSLDFQDFLIGYVHLPRDVIIGNEGLQRFVEKSPHPLVSMLSSPHPGRYVLGFESQGKKYGTGDSSGQGAHCRSEDGAVWVWSNS